jgi:hypothetical protein
MTKHRISASIDPGLLSAAEASALRMPRRSLGVGGFRIARRAPVRYPAKDAPSHSVLPQF